jgi:hypothetical protein
VSSRAWLVDHTMMEQMEQMEQRQKDDTRTKSKFIDLLLVYRQELIDRLVEDATSHTVLV